MRTLVLSTAIGLLIFAATGSVTSTDAAAAENETPLRAGIIGVDTSHATEFTKVLNDPKSPEELAGVRVVAAYPGGSPDVELSQKISRPNTEALRGMGVEIVDSIDELVKRVDVVLLESVDGRPHLRQARPVIAAEKPLFIDKPLAASLSDAMEIFRLAREKNVPCFSSSALRFGKGVQAVRGGTSPLGEVRSCTAWSPMGLEPHHPDLFWYGIHGVESLFTVMGAGCESVTRTSQNTVVGQWKDGRRGTFVGKEDQDGFGVTIQGTRKNGTTGEFEGYRPLLIEIVKFFKTGKPPVSQEETLEIIAFMEAADLSKKLGGKPVTLQDAMKKAAETAGK
ncbi:MAG: Gfo/Idh/MocA family oxidoreductase [Planctomycetaceae bacterium]|nr:Gfo/Idh/MocA family oxidoreductase [Planctomycetaceae bacterium]